MQQFTTVILMLLNKDLLSYDNKKEVSLGMLLKSLKYKIFN